jgi:DNA/RNA endonuclease G (NUC1)
MKQLLLLILTPIIIGLTFTPTKLNIKHGDMTLYLDSDTNSFVSVLNIKYSKFKLDSDRDNKWFQDKYKGIYSKQTYLYSGYDLGHLTPSHITSYDDTLNHNSFSLFNQAPQLAAFNRGKWAQLEGSVEDSIFKYKTNVSIITGVIYNNKKKTYLNKSRIKIPISYYKILSIKSKNLTYVWIGSNVNGEVIQIDIKKLNEILKMNQNEMFFKD